MAHSLPLMRALPDAGGLPGIGHLPAMLSDPLTTLNRLESRLGPVFRTRLLRDAVVLLGPDANARVLQNRDGEFSSAGGWGWFIDPVFPGAVMSMDDPAHRFQRRIMQAAFKKQALVRYLDHMGPEIGRVLGRWLTGDAVPVFPAIKQLTLDLATRVFMGVEPGPESARVDHAFIDAVEAPIALIRSPLPPFKMWRGVKGREYLVRHFRELMPRKRDSDAPDFFSQFCQARDEQGRRFSDQEIIDHMIFLMMAAHDTTTSTLTTLFHALGRHPQWQERLRERSLAMPDDTLAFDDLESLQEIDWCMKEALRLYPPLTSIPRRTTREVEFAGHRLPADTLVGVFPLHTHYMPAWWSEPYRFDPERFAPARAEHRGHAFQWIPFGGGAHRCIGQHFAELQVKAILHQVLRRFRWQVPASYRLPWQAMPISKPRDGLPLRLQRLR